MEVIGRNGKNALAQMMEKNISKIGTCSDFNILQHIGKSFSPFQDTLLQYI